MEEGVKPVATTTVCYQQEASHSELVANANCACVSVLIQHEQRGSAPARLTGV